MENRVDNRLNTKCRRGIVGINTDISVFWGSRGGGLREDSWDPLEKAFPGLSRNVKFGADRRCREKPQNSLNAPSPCLRVLGGCS